MCINIKAGLLTKVNQNNSLLVEIIGKLKSLRLFLKDVTQFLANMTKNQTDSWKIISDQFNCTSSNCRTHQQ